MITCQIETVDSWWAGAGPCEPGTLIWDHWHELGLDLDLEGSVNVDQLRSLENAGLWLTMTARDDGKLVGYVLALFSKHLHYSTSGPMMIVDMYYIAPQYRHGVGVQLFKFMEATARAKNAIKIYLSCKVHQDHSKLFQALGYRLSDYAFVKRTG